MRALEKLQKKISGVCESENTCHHDYFALIKELINEKTISDDERKRNIDRLYGKVYGEIIGNDSQPISPVKFGTSGWRGVLGKDLFCKSVAQVLYAIVEMYKGIDEKSPLLPHLGVKSLQEAQQRGCVVGFDNRYRGDILARVAVEVLDREGFRVHYAGESTTGVLSAAVLQLDAAFSINFTPSHNPLEYGGLKYNAADGGPAATELTSFITAKSLELIDKEFLPPYFSLIDLPYGKMSKNIAEVDTYSLWLRHVCDNEEKHGVNFNRVIDGFLEAKDFVIAVDSVHGASRLHLERIFKKTESLRLVLLRNEVDVTFGGVAPEPSSENMKGVVELLRSRPEKYKLGAIIDPDGDRIRFTDGEKEISMNQFGAMSYHFLHQSKKKRGPVAKTVATSNLANSIAARLGEKVFEPPVGFKEFKPVVGKALVCFEESDGISIIGHTPEKDAYIGLLLAIDMVLSTGQNLSEYLEEIESVFGYFYPDRDGVEVSAKGKDLLKKLSLLEKYDVGSTIDIGGEKKTITEVIDIDGRKMILEDGSWLMIRPSGTEPKVRFYVEARTRDGSARLVKTAEQMLRDIGLM